MVLLMNILINKPNKIFQIKDLSLEGNKISREEMEFLKNSKVP